MGDHEPSGQAWLKRLANDVMLSRPRIQSGPKTAQTLYFTPRVKIGSFHTPNKKFLSHT